MKFPEFSRGNIESLGPNEHFFKGLFYRFALKKKYKVFVISFGKTGTTSVCHALQELGYRVAGDYSSQISNPRYDVLWSYGEKVLNKYDGYQDFPWCLFYKELYEKYPDGKFIFLTRDTESWYSSLIRHQGAGERLRHETFYNTKDVVNNSQIVKDAYDLHEKNVRAFFKDKENQPLYTNIKDLNWEILWHRLYWKMKSDGI